MQITAIARPIANLITSAKLTVPNSIHSAKSPIRENLTYF